MTLCNLCKSREANKTGSHIFTHSIIKYAINEKGSKERDKELMHSLSSSSIPKLYSGRKVLPETKQSVLNKAIQETEINAHVYDNIFCIECEGKMGQIIESEFANRVYIKLKKVTTEIEKLMFENLKDFLLIKVFSILQIWRASIVNYHSFKLYKNYEEEFRNLILEYCDKFSIALD